VVKVIVADEVGADDVRHLLEAAAVAATSIVTYAECRAAIASAVRSGRMARPQSLKAIAHFDGLWASLTRVAVHEPLVRRAGGLADAHSLRGFDAIHLASALTLGGDTRMVSYDADLCAAAAGEGLTTFPER